MFNPSRPDPTLNNPTQRANELNDPQFEEQQGYFPYDLTHSEFLTTRYGEVTPTCNMHTIPGDRVVFRGNDKTVLTQINGNFLGTVNEYSDSFFVPLRSLYPNNYEKLIPNPTKGDDLPVIALPKFPLSYFVNSYLRGVKTVRLLDDGDLLVAQTFNGLMHFSFDIDSQWFAYDVALTRWFALLTMFSRGQLLDYLGYSLSERLQSYIDSAFLYFTENMRGDYISMYYPLTSDDIDNAATDIVIDRPTRTLSEVRDAISYAFEHGYIIGFDGVFSPELFRSGLLDIFSSIEAELDYYLVFDIDELEITTQDAFESFNNGGSDISVNYRYINLSTVLAYQQVIAQYYSNNSVDNIFNADLYMQNLRSVMYPSRDGTQSSEPVFYYNGVETRLDLISLGASLYSLVLGESSGSLLMRQYYYITLMFLLRNSLRYGDYFSTARPNMLAVGDLTINVEDGAVSPIDITQNLLKQRYLNAANYIGSGFLPYMASIFGVTPSDTGTYPRFIGHYKQTLRSDIVTNTANETGRQYTNLLGYSDGNSWDCFIDDYGVMLVLKSYDVLPVYTKGVDKTFGFSDRFDLFNPMLQNIGDQPILGSEIGGDRDYVFGYTMRNAEYKYKISRAHGAFVNSLRGFFLPLPVDYYVKLNGIIHINPDFIRDRPVFFDSVVSQQTGTSPATYYHFIVSCVNELKTARKMQATPPVLF